MEKILRAVNKRPALCRGLRLVSHFAGIFAFILFAFVFMLAVISSPLSAVKLCAIIGLSYVAVSLARRFINAPRPYEVYDFYESPPKDKKGVSFPSRHTFLVFAIATVCMPASAVPAIILLVLGVLLAVSRVLIGIHFIRDVVTGAMLGILSSVLGLLILNPF